MSTVPADEMLLRIADAMGKVHTEADRGRLAERLGLDSQLITMLAGGRQGITQMMDEVRDSGQILDEFRARQLADTNDELDKMNHALTSAGDAAAAAFAPGVAYSASVLEDAIAKAQEYGKWIGYISMGRDMEREEESAKNNRRDSAGFNRMGVTRAATTAGPHGGRASQSA